MADTRGRHDVPLEPSGSAVVEVLAENARKGTRTLLVERPGGRAVRKSIAVDAPPEWRARFEVERELYRTAGFRLKPRLLDAGEDWFLLEHVSGATLRRRLGQGLGTHEMVEVLSTVVAELGRERRHLAEADDLDRLADSGSSRLRNLLSSGPAGTTRSRWNERLCAAAAASLPVVLRSRLRHALGRWSSAGARVVAPFGHCDLHGNNVLIGPFGPVVIDFENATRPGCWLVDAWYLLATTAAAAPADARDAVRAAVRRTVLDAEPLLADGYDVFEAAFTRAALANGRFACTTPGARAGRDLLRASAALARYGGRSVAGRAP